jgi:hypothetical protein
MAIELTGAISPYGMYQLQWTWSVDKGPPAAPGLKCIPELPFRAR